MEVRSSPRGWGKRYATFFDLRMRKRLGQHVHVLEPGMAWCNADEPCKGTVKYVPQQGSPLPVSDTQRAG